MSDAKNHETIQGLREFIETNGYPPSIRELGQVLGLSSTDTVRKRLLACESAGLITREADKPRSIRIMEDADDAE